MVAPLICPNSLEDTTMNQKPHLYPKHLNKIYVYNCNSNESVIILNEPIIGCHWSINWESISARGIRLLNMEKVEFDLKLGITMLKIL